MRASPGAACRERIVSAYARPSGNGRRSTSIICRRIGTASMTPRKLTARIHSASCHHTIVTPVAMNSAGIALVRPAPVKYPAAEAALAIVLFSSDVKSRLNGPNGTARLRPEKMPKASTAAVTVTASPQPVLRPTYRFDRLITPPSNMPVTTARGVSCGTCGLYTCCSQYVSISSCVIGVPSGCLSSGFASSCAS